MPVVADARALPRRLWGVDPDAVEGVFADYVLWIDEINKELAALRYENGRLRQQLEVPATDAPVVRPYIDHHAENSGHYLPGMSGPNLGRRFD